ncbi:MAG: hypothetical protein FJ110_14865 [Deltaproteobacteria bacterium]|nr:hypothetical protein [Deltaproteobacteria bacterium]
MKKLIITVSLIVLLLMPSFVFSQTEQVAAGAPPIEQPLVREGDLAVKLVETLQIGKAGDEGEAETILSSSGIAPKNGWIADYPVTPDIIGELQNAIGRAADLGKIPMDRKEALKRFEDLTTNLGFPIVADTSGTPAGSETRKGYSDQTVINNYYYTEGPPVVTYYPPPWDYHYLYSWVHWPFWYHGFHFHGFFVLWHFHRPIFVQNKVVVITNRVFDPVSKKVFVVDPGTRSIGKFVTGGSGKTGTSGFKSEDARRGAASIVERNRERTSGSGREMRVAPSPTSPTGRGEGPARQRIPDRAMGRDRSETGGSGSSGRVFNRQESVAPRSEMNFQRPSPSAPAERFSSGQGRGLSSGGSSGSGRSERNFSTPGRGRESSGAPFTGSRGSSGEFRSGSFSGGFSGGSGGGGRGSPVQGSSGNRGGGCRGRC